MKVLHIVHSIERSGLEMMLLGAVEPFRDAGVETHVLSTGVCEGELAGRFREAGYVVHHAPFRTSSAFFRGLHGMLRRQHFDVVHIHTEQAFFWYGLTARLAGVPRVVYHAHGTFPFRGYLRLERVVQRLLGRVALGMTCIAVSPSVVANERRRFFNPSVLAPNWVDAESFRPASPGERQVLRERFGLPVKAPLVASVGACTALKNHALIVRCLPLVREDVPAVQYAHAGVGGEEAGERALAARLGVADACHFLGSVDDVAGLLAACDILVMPSTHEGFGMATLEALSCGVPVVATDVPGLRDAVADGQTGVLARSEPQAFADAIVSLLRDPGLRNRLGEEGRRRVLERFTPAAGVAAWVAEYRG